METMRYVSVLCLMAIMILSACNESSTESAQSKPLFTIDLNTSFRSDSVKVELDGAVVFNDTTSTYPMSIIASRIATDVIFGEHRVKVSIVNKNVSYEESVTIATDTLTLGVFYDRGSSKISFTKLTFLPFYM
jgi:hypothetical protein